MKTKADVRKQLEAGMSVFLGSGKIITKIDAKKTRSTKPQPKEQNIEIEVQHLPKALQDKFFGE